MFAVTILGNNSAVPAGDRYPTAQVVTYQNRLYLIDCGEGTQMQMTKYKIRRSKIDHVFISHLHGDHYFGLIGLINSYSLLGRQEPLHIYGPPQLKDIIDLQLNCANTHLAFQLLFTPLYPDKTGLLLEDKYLRVHNFKTNHRIDCFGFLFEERKNKRKVLPDKAKEYNIPVNFFSQLQAGENYESPDGKIIPNETVTAAPLKSRRYAFCADTAYDESFLPVIKNCDLLYHETTYLQDQAERAAQRYHTTTVQAAALAKKANVKKLLIGHFSSKYETLEPFEQECKTIFPNTEIATQGTTFKIGE